MTVTTTSPIVSLSGRLDAIPPERLRQLMNRGADGAASVRDVVAQIIGRVRRDGDSALLALARELDSAKLQSVEVPRNIWKRALKNLPLELRAAMDRAAANIAAVSKASMPVGSQTSPEAGIIVGRRPDALATVGVYAPGGTAAYPSSVLMGAIPARIAGVRNVLLASPPGRNGLPSELILAAAELANVDRVFAIGGAGAIAAFAYGSETVPRTDKIVGPGNAYVAEAKLQVSNVVAIDSPAGPSEIAIIADGSASADLIAAELIAQAEHDVHASAIALLLAPNTSGEIIAALARLLENEPRRAVAEGSLLARGAVLECDSLDAAIAFATDYAPEHLLLAIDSPADALPSIRNAGTVFIGASTSAVFGDYMTGANHVLPTGGMARGFSGLSVLDFMRWTSYQSVSPDAARALSRDTAVFAAAEGLPAHATAARLRGVA